MRHTVGSYMVQPQSGVALVNSVGANYSDEWGRRKNVKFQGSFFFNHTDTENNSRTEKWYESPMPIGYMYNEGFSNTLNLNARFNARLDWKISRNASLMSRTAFSYQGNNPESKSQGYTIGENDDAEELEGSSHQSLAYSKSTNWSRMNAFQFSEFLQLRIKLGKPGRTIRTMSVSRRPQLMMRMVFAITLANMTPNSTTILAWVSRGWIWQIIHCSTLHSTNILLVQQKSMHIAYL